MSSTLEIAACFREETGIGFSLTELMSDPFMHFEEVADPVPGQRIHPAPQPHTGRESRKKHRPVISRT